MGNNQRLRFAIRAAIAAAAATGAVPVAMSQTVSAGITPTADLEEVVVTGTRLQSPNITSISPITTVTAVDIQNSNLTRVEDFLNELPMVFADQNSTVSNGADGTAAVDLRGLGAKRTLVLVNGRRLGPGNGDGRNYSDINEIPAALVDRVDILTGGASSTYGADAVAGVVNFVLNTHFEGVKIDATYNFDQHTNDNSVAYAAANAGDALPDHKVNTSFGKNVSVLMGSNFADGKGNATFYFTYDKAAATLQSKYDYSACTLGAASAGTLRCSGSPTAASHGAGGYFQAYGSNGALFTNTVDPKTGAFRPYNAATDAFNFGPINFFQRPNERYTGGSFLNYDINDKLNAYGELMFTRNTSQAQIAPSGDFFTPTFIPCADPLLTAQEAAAICAAGVAQGNPAGANLYIGRRNAEGGGRVASFDSNAFRVVIGLKGTIIDGLTFDAYAQRSSVDNSDSNLNYFSSTRVQNALNVVAGPGGVPTCESVIDGSDPACVPWNIWKPNGVTAAALNYLSIPLLTEASTTEQVVSGSVSADLGTWGIKSPLAQEGIKVNVGAEYRNEYSSFQPDLASEEGTAEGAGGASVPVAGSFHVRELFTELGVPIFEHLPGAESLSLDIGYRYSEYSLGFNTNTYKFGVEYAPIKDIRIRAAYARAVRAPNIGELFAPQAVALDGSTDPCAGPTPSATEAQCLLTGLTAAQYGHIGANSASQYNGLLGGNPDLKPEKTDTYTAGLVFTPQFAPDLSMSFDYFNIKIDNVIGAIGADTIINNCIATGSAAYCDAIHRDPNGSLFRTEAGYISDTNVNFGSLTTRGIDAKINYRITMAGAGALIFSLDGTRLANLGTEPLTGGPAFDCAGYFGTTCGSPNPKWRHIFSTTWATPWSGFDLTARWRFLSGVDSEQLSTNPALSAPTALPLSEHIKPYSYLDLAASVALSKEIHVQVGINNLLDKDPPVVPGASASGFVTDCAAVSCNGNTYPGVYDSLGRYLFARVTAQF